AVGADGAEHLRGVVGGRGVAGVVPGDADVAGSLVQRDAGQELTAGVGGGVEDVDPGAPGLAVVVGETLVDLAGAAAGGGGVAVDEIGAAVVRAAGAVPGQAGLGVDAEVVALGGVAGVVAADLG